MTDITTRSGFPEINASKPWSKMDDDDLRFEIESVASRDDAAMVLCRPLAEVTRRAAELGLSWAERSK